MPIPFWVSNYYDYFLNFYLLIYFIIICEIVGLCWVFTAACGLSRVMVFRLPIEVASLVAEHGL